MFHTFRKESLILSFLLLCLLGLAGCGAAGGGQGGAGEANAPQVEAPLPVAVTKAEQKEMLKTLTLGGLLKPMEEVVLMGGGAGSRVLSVAVSVGDRVSKGQVILTQDMRDLAIQEQNLLISRAQIEDNQAQLNDNLTQLIDTYEKNKALFDVGALAEAQLTSLDSQIKGLDTQLKGLDNQTKQINLQLETLRLNREKMAVTSTIDGIVSVLPVVEGQMAAASTVVAQVVNIDKLLLDVQVGETYIMGIQKGDLMEIMIPAFGEQSVTGRVRTIPPNINPQTRAYTVTIEVDNDDLAIKGGMYGEIQLVVERIHDALVIPQYAVLKMDEGLVVYIEENGIAYRRLVTLGMTLGNEAQVLSGLRVGDNVITEGQYTATDGRPVNVLNRGGAQ